MHSFSPAFALQHDTLLRARRGKLMGLQQRLTPMTFEWAKRLFPLGFEGLSQFRVHSVGWAVREARNPSHKISLEKCNLAFDDRKCVTDVISPTGTGQPGGPQQGGMCMLDYT